MFVFLILPASTLILCLSFLILCKGLIFLKEYQRVDPIPQPKKNSGNPLVIKKSSTYELQNAKELISQNIDQVGVI